jgi:hypothetical protein
MRASLISSTTASVSSAVCIVRLEPALERDG